MHRVVRAVAGEVAVCVVLIGVAAVTWREAARLPAGRYDPLGGGMLPMIVCAGIIILSLVAILMSVAKAARAARTWPERATKSDQLPPRYLLAAGIFLATAAFTASIWLRVPFWISSVVFVFVCFGLITRFERASLLSGVVLSGVIGLSLTYVFARVFQVDLP